MAKINIKQLFKEITPAITRELTSSRKNLAFGTAVSIFRPKKDALMEYFNNHPVTQEIEAAENSDPISVSNTSGLLSGRGNLFTFLGFTLGRKPIKDLRELLINEIRVENRLLNVTNDGNFFYFRFPIRIPSDAEIEQRTPMDWESGNSWVRGIEIGVSGFSNYIYWKKILNNPDVSRSTAGTQAKAALRGGDMRTSDYILKRLNEFRRVNRKII